MPSALITGGTGYVGGPYLIWFKSQYPEYKITATSRSTVSTKLLKDLGVNVVEDPELPDFQKAASEADVVVNIADGSSLPLLQAITAGLKTRFELTKIRPTLIHMGGGLAILDPTPFAQSGVTSDADEAQLRAIPATNPIRSLELEVRAADAAGYLWGYVIAPPLVYGLSQTPLGRSDSIIWRAYIFPAILPRREVAYVGDGSYTWDSVHIDDLTDLNALVTKQALSGAAESDNPYDRYFFATNGKPASWKDMLEKIGPVLHEEGLVKNAHAVSRSVEDVPELWFLAGNMRSSADRGIALGWKPSRPGILEFEGLEDEIRNAVKSPLNFDYIEALSTRYKHE